MLTRKSIRKALEDRLWDALVAAGVVYADLPQVPRVAYPGQPFDRSLELSYVRSFITHSYVDVKEIGPTPRIEAGGFANFDCYTLSKLTPDANDELAAVVGAAFPYNLTLVRDGVNVTIGAVDTRQTNPDGDAWLQGPVLVPWNVWRI